MVRHSNKKIKYLKKNFKIYKKHIEPKKIKLNFELNEKHINKINLTAPTPTVKPIFRDPFKDPFNFKDLFKF